MHAPPKRYTFYSAIHNYYLANELEMQKFERHEAVGV